jgi:cytochrome b involved in lipid metabolism
MDARFTPFVIVVFAMLVSGCVTFDPSSLSNGAPSSPAAPNSPGSPSTTQTSIPSSSGNLTLTVEEVAKHGSASDCWTIINGKVLDLTSFSSPPGGSAYVPYCGKDGTAGYDTKGGRGSPHSSGADSMLASYTIGNLGETINLQSTSIAPSGALGQSRERETEDD